MTQTDPRSEMCKTPKKQWKVKVIWVRTLDAKERHETVARILARNLPRKREASK